jgi:hypothetical protein
MICLPDDLRDRLHLLAETQERTLSDVGIEVVRRGLAGIPVPSSASFTLGPPPQGA